MKSRDKTITVADDDRARVPFAMIGALILVSSVGLVVTLQLQRDATVDVDDSLAMERTASAANTALSDATTQATHDAALEPVTEPADTPLGNAISDDGTYTGDEFFERYVKLRIYLEAQENFASSGQQFREMDTSISIDPVEGPDDVEDAIDSVSLAVGGNETNETLTAFEYGDDPDTGLGHGTIEVTIDDVEFTVERDGEVVAERTQPISVTVGTPLFDLHHLTTEYEAQLNYDFADARAANESAGFDQYFASRLYPLAWERAYAQNEGEPIANVLANRHIETLANDAAFQTQRAVFGNDDPQSDRTLTTAYACLLAQDHGVSDALDPGTDVYRALEDVDEAGFCDGLGYTYENLDERFTDPPDWTDFDTDDDYLNGNETVGLDDVSSVVAGELESEGGVEAAIDRVYAVDVGTETEVETTVYPSAYEDGANSELHEFTVEVLDRKRLLDEDETGTEREFHEFTLLFSGLFERDAPGEEIEDVPVRYEVTLTIEGEHGPDSEVTQRGIDHDYEWGPSNDPETRYDHNFDAVPETAIEEVFVGVDDHTRATDQIEAYFEDEYDEIVDTDAILNAGDFVDVLTGERDEWTVEPETYEYDREGLRAWLVSELDELQDETSAVRIDTERQAFLEDEPFADLAEQIESDDEWVYQHVDGDHYVNAPDKARSELFLEYMSRLRDRVDTAAERHNETIDEFDSEIADQMDSDTEGVTEFTAERLETDPTDPVADLPEYPLLEGIEVTPNGEPTYLTLDRVRQEHVPAVGDREYGFAPMTARNDDIYGVPFENSGDGVRLEVAGEVLEAGALTDELVTDSNWDDGRTDELESALGDWIDRYGRDVGSTAAAPFDNLSRGEATRAVQAEIDALGSIEEQAMRIGEGEDALDRMASNIASEADLSDVTAPRAEVRMQFEDALRFGFDSTAEWDRGVVSDPTVTEQTARLGYTVRAALNETNAAVLDERLNGSAAERSLTLDPFEPADSWLESDELAPNRLPAGTTVVDIPMWTVGTMNIWQVELEGEYSRFRVAMNAGTSSVNEPTEYVREDVTATLEIGDTAYEAGHVDAIGFESQLSVPILAPSDGLGIGDRAGDRPECSETFPEVGIIEGEPAVASCTDG